MVVLLNRPQECFSQTGLMLFFLNRRQWCFLTDEKTVGHREVAKFMLHNREAVGWEGNTQILKEMQTEKRR